VKVAMIRAAGQVILVADSSKWEKITLTQISSWSGIQVLITDVGLPAKAVELLETQGVKVYLA
jgi:DeoR/GlpR family transcriptional regulator of sugar metabolism